MNASTHLLPSAVRFSLVLSPIFLWAAHIDAGFVNAADPVSAPLLYSENLNYEGSFKMPSGTFGGSKFSWAIPVAAYNSLNNSLFLVGHDQDQMVAEVSIPTPLVTTQAEDLPIATILQPFTDPSEGLMYTIDDGTIVLGGLLVFNNKLYGTAYDFYDADNSTTLSHFSSSLDLSEQGDAEGMYQVGTEKAGYVSGFMTHIPPEWQTSFGGPAITGNCCISIISRSSYGPAAFVFDPATVGQQSPVPATPLMYYTYGNPLGGTEGVDQWGEASSVWNGSTQIRGVVFPKNSRSILFFGNQGTGTWCYGTGSECNDPVVSSKGVHAYPYVPQVWAYDALDLLKVKNGEVSPWEIAPYQIWELSLPFPSENFKSKIGGTYDPATQRIFITEKREDDTLRVHVFKLNHDTTGSDTTPPGTVQGLTVN